MGVPFDTIQKLENGGGQGYTGKQAGDGNAFQRILNEVEQARKLGMTAREYAMSKGAPSSLTDAEAASLDLYNLKGFKDEADQAAGTDELIDKAVKNWNGTDTKWTPANDGAGDKAKNLIGKDFEGYLTNKFGGNGSFSRSGRDFDGGVDNRWWEAKSGQYWDMLENKPNQFAKFKSDMGHRLKIAAENNATYELFSNTPIPQAVKEWLNKKGIPFTELLD